MSVLSNTFYCETQTALKIQSLFKKLGQGGCYFMRRVLTLKGLEHEGEV